MIRSFYQFAVPFVLLSALLLSCSRDKEVYNLSQWDILTIDPLSIQFETWAKERIDLPFGSYYPDDKWVGDNSTAKCSYCNIDFVSAFSAKEHIDNDERVVSAISKACQTMLNEYDLSRSFMEKKWSLLFSPLIVSDIDFLFTPIDGGPSVSLKQYIGIKNVGHHSVPIILSNKYNYLGVLGDNPLPISKYLKNKPLLVSPVSFCFITEPPLSLPLDGHIKIVYTFDNGTILTDSSSNGGHIILCP